MAAELKVFGSVAAAAAACGVLEESYVHRFSALARAAGWESRTPADYLAGRPTPERRGGHRTGEDLGGNGVHIGGRVLPETRRKADMARDAAGLTWEAFIRGAAEYILSGKRFVG